MVTKSEEMMEIFSFTSNGIYDYQAEDGHDFVTPIYTLFLNESSLVIRKKRKNQGMNGGYHYKSLGSFIYKVQTNKHGEKYLRVLHKTGTGVILTVPAIGVSTSDLYALPLGVNRFTSDVYARPSGTNHYCAEMIQLIEEHMSKLFGFKFTYGPVPDEDDPEAGQYTPDYLCYPFYRQADSKEFVKRILEENRKQNAESYGVQDDFRIRLIGVRGLHQALRNSKTQTELITNMVYKSYIKTDADGQLIMDSPKLLNLFSRIDLRVTATEAVSCGFVDVFENYDDCMTTTEFYAFKFMLDSLPKSKVSEVLDLVLQLSEFRKGKEVRTQLKADIKQLNRFSYGSSCNGHLNLLLNYFQQVPLKDRQKFAVAFWKDFKKSYLESEKNYLPLSEISKKDRLVRRDIGENFVKVADVYMNAYASMYLESIATGRKESCLNAAKELFGQDISQCKEVAFETTKVDELNLSIEHVNFHNFRSSTTKNLLTLLDHNADTKKLIDYVMIFSPIKHIFIEHLNLSNAVVALVSDLEKILREAAKKIDTELTRIGQPLTPQNRMIYLQSTAKDRKVKINWKYYSLGVDPNEVPTYRTAGIRSKKDILFWVETKQSVPAEMYEELLNDAAYGSFKAQKNSLMAAF